MGDKDGGAAFPRPYSQHDDGTHIGFNFNEQGGMTLRDYFAGQELGGPDSAEGPLGRIWEWLWYGPARSYEEAAKDAYDMADAMLKERDDG